MAKNKKAKKATVQLKSFTKGLFEKTLSELTGTPEEVRAKVLDLVPEAKKRLTAFNTYQAAVQAGKTEEEAAKEASAASGLAAGQVPYFVKRVKNETHAAKFLWPSRNFFELEALAVYLNPGVEVNLYNYVLNTIQNMIHLHLVQEVTRDPRVQELAATEEGRQKVTEYLQQSLSSAIVFDKFKTWEFFQALMTLPTDLLAAYQAADEVLKEGEAKVADGTFQFQELQNYFARFQEVFVPYLDVAYANGVEATTAQTVLQTIPAVFLNRLHGSFQAKAQEGAVAAAAAAVAAPANPAHGEEGHVHGPNCQH